MPYPICSKCNFKDGGISLEQARFLDPSTIYKMEETYKLRTGDIPLSIRAGTGTVGRTRSISMKVIWTISCLLFLIHVFTSYWSNRYIIPHYLYAYISIQFIQHIF